MHQYLLCFHHAFNEDFRDIVFQMQKRDHTQRISTGHYYNFNLSCSMAAIQIRGTAYSLYSVGVF